MLLWLRDSADGQRVLDALQAVKNDEEHARTANSPDARERARTALGETAGTLLDALGVTSQLQQQMVDHALGEPGVDRPSHALTFAELTRPEMARTTGGLAILRNLAARGVLTLFSLLGAKFSAATVHELRGIGKGREGIFTFIPKTGVARDGGPAHALQEETVSRLGYTVGAPAQLKWAMLKRAADYYNRRAAQHGLSTTKPATVRDWCQRPHALVYEDARKEGARDRRDGNINSERLLL